MLGALEESQRAAAPARRRRVARAAHAADEPAHEHRGARAAPSELPPGERERLLADVVEQLGEMTTLVADLIELARGEQHAPSPRTCASTARRRGAVERARRNRPGVAFETELERVARARRARALDRAVAQPARQRGQVEPARRRVEVSVRDGEVTVRDHGPGIADGGPAVRLRPLLPRAPRRAGCPARGSASRSCARSRRPTAGPSSRSAPRAAGLSCASISTARPKQTLSEALPAVYPALRLVRFHGTYCPKPSQSSSGRASQPRRSVPTRRRP